MDTHKTFANELSTWSKKGLSRLYGKGVLKEPEVIADFGMAPLKLAIGLGPESLKEIAEVLYKCGYIDDVERWLAG